MQAIVAVDSNWAIGNKGQLLIRIPNDMKNFRAETMGKVLVYGRKTLETFPGQQPLEGRKNIILSTNPDYVVKNATVVHNLDELQDAIKEYDTDIRDHFTSLYSLDRLYSIADELLSDGAAIGTLSTWAINTIYLTEELFPRSRNVVKELSEWTLMRDPDELDPTLFVYL